MTISLSFDWQLVLLLLGVMVSGWLTGFLMGVGLASWFLLRRLRTLLPFGIPGAGGTASRPRGWTPPTREEAKPM